jgi:hypothetical protein
MSKKTILTGYEKLADGALLLHTNHYSVQIRFMDRFCYGAKQRASRRNDLLVSVDYAVINKTTYTTNLGVKKFLYKFIVNSLKSKINYEVYKNG